jgi:hypothetical protein
MSNDYIVISSRNRIKSGESDYDSSFTGFDTGHYRCRFQTTVNVEGKKLRLVTGKIPSTVFVINSYNASFEMTEAGPITTMVTLVQGHYNPTTLATEIGTRMTAASAVAVVYTAAYSNTTKKIVITAAGANPFTLNWATGASYFIRNKLWRQLGFTSADGAGPADSTSVLTAGNHVCTPLFSVSLAYCESYHIRFSLDGQPIRSSEVAGLGDQPSMVIPNTFNPGDEATISGDLYRYSLLPKHPHLRNFTVRITDEQGTPVSFNNHDTIFVFELQDLEEDE